MSGGAGAISEITDALWSVEHALYLVEWNRTGRKGQRPEYRAYPGPADAAEQAAKYTEKRAAAWRAKYRDRLPR